MSGYYHHRFRGKTDRQWLTAWTKQLVRRGWPADTYARLGSDGLYGPEYRELVKAFQADQGLTRDGLLGRKPWDAVYRNPIR